MTGTWLRFIFGGIDLIGTTGYGHPHPRNDSLNVGAREIVAGAGGIEEQQSADTNLERFRKLLPEALWNRSN
jgi:hypothetical protein